MSAYNLFIVESPAKCGKIEQYLGPGNKCIASYGHFREINGLTAINIHKNFAPTFMLSINKQSQVTKLRKVIKEAREVFLATDDDREGEAIAWHLCDYFNLPVATTKRIVFHEVTEPALKRAVENYRYVNMAIVNAQFARQVLDILVGYKLSPMLWKNVKDGTSAGRCQTPALRLVYENYKDIQASPGSKEYNITGYFTGQTIPFVLNYNFKLPAEEEEDGAAAAEAANEELLSFLNDSVGFEHVYKCGELRDTIKTPPTPFTTSKLQQVASSTLHMSPKETMSVCQKLYEEGYITYMRTDSTVYASEFIEKAVKYITSEYGGEFVSPHIEGMAGSGATGASVAGASASVAVVKDTKKKQPVLAQEAHEAIRPTNINVKTLNDGVDVMGAKAMGAKAMGPKECKLYQLIWSNTLESCMTNALYKGLTVTITAPQNHSYKFTTEQMLFSGWKMVNSCEEVNKEFVYLQTLKPNSVVKYKKIAAKVSVKQLKTHYTEAKLVQLLEEKGIGRPSTFSALIEKIQDRGYVKKENVKGALIKCTDYELSTAGKLVKNITEREFGNEKNKLVIKPLGMMVIEYLLKHFNTLFEYDYTKHMETQLDAIATTHKVWHDLCKECLTDIEASISTVAQECKGKETIRVDDEHVYMMGKYGPVLKCTTTTPTSAPVSAPASPSESSPSASSPLTNNAKHEKDNNNTATVSFKPVKPDIDLAKLRSGEYSLEEVLVEPSAEKAGRLLGSHKEKDVVLRSGKFGWYIEWGLEKKALKLTLPEATALTLEDVADVLFDLENGETGIIRAISKETSIRKGKFGDYIFHKNKKMKKPKFLKLTAFKGDYVKCDIEELHTWLKKTYDINKCE